MIGLFLSAFPQLFLLWRPVKFDRMDEPDWSISRSFTGCPSRSVNIASFSSDALNSRELHYADSPPFSYSWQIRDAELE